MIKSHDKKSQRKTRQNVTKSQWQNVTVTKSITDKNVFLMIVASIASDPISKTIHFLNYTYSVSSKMARRPLWMKVL